MQCDKRKSKNPQFYGQCITFILLLELYQLENLNLIGVLDVLNFDRQQ